MSEPDPKTVELVSKALDEQGILTPEVLAYALATIQAETSNKGPVREGFSDAAGRKAARRNGYSGGENYYGRGFIQLTHDYNYKQMGDRIGIDLYSNPDLALEPEVAAKVLATFFKDRGVAQKVMSGDIYGARSPINGTNRADEIKNNYYNYLNDVKTNKYPLSTQGPQPEQTPTKGSFFDFLKPKQVQAAEQYLSPAIPKVSAYTPNTSAYTMGTSPTVWGNTLLANAYAAKQAIPTATVKKGDTLWALSKQLLGSGARWKELQGFTGDPKKLPIGTIITAPTAVKPALSTTTPLQKAIAKTAGAQNNPYTFTSTPEAWAKSVMSQTPVKTSSTNYIQSPLSSPYKKQTIPGMLDLGSYIQ